MCIIDVFIENVFVIREHDESIAVLAETNWGIHGLHGLHSSQLTIVSLTLCRHTAHRHPRAETETNANNTIHYQYRNA